MRHSATDDAALRRSSRGCRPPRPGFEREDAGGLRDDDAVRPRINVVLTRWLEDWVGAGRRARSEPSRSTACVTSRSSSRTRRVTYPRSHRARALRGERRAVVRDRRQQERLVISWTVSSGTSTFGAECALADLRRAGRRPGAGQSRHHPRRRKPLDLRLAFIAYVDSFWGGTLKARVGRQEMAFDLQRFVSVRDGPNVRQAYDGRVAGLGKG